MLSYVLENCSDKFLNALLKYALLMNPLARGIEELLPARFSDNLWCFISVRTALALSSLCVAFVLPFFGK